MEVLSKQKPMCIRLYAIRCHSNGWCGCAITLTALMMILFLFNGCYGDQIERDQGDIDTGISQVQFKAHHQRQVLNLTLHDNPLLRDKTIKSETVEAAGVTAASSIVTAHVLLNKSDRSVEWNGQTTTPTAVKTTTNNRFDPKRDQHRKVHQSHNIINNENALALELHEQSAAAYKHFVKNTSEKHDGHIVFNKQPERVPYSKPKISSKLLNAPSVDRRTTTYLSYNLVRNNVQKTTQRFMPISYQRSQHTQQIKQTSKNYIYKSYVRPIQRNNCNKCRIVPGAPLRHKPYSPTTRIRYHGKACDNLIVASRHDWSRN